jgi:hypothetical protein
MNRLLLLPCLILIAVGLLFAQSRAVLQPSATVNVTGPALLHPEGKSIRVNGLLVTGPTLIFPGDKIETGGDTAAYLIRPGKIWTLDRNSLAVFQGDALLPSQGRVWASNGSQPAQELGSRMLDEDLAQSNFNDDGCHEVPYKYRDVCDVAENECQQKYHEECLCHYNKSKPVSPITPSDFTCYPMR